MATPRWHPAEILLLCAAGVLLGALLPLMDPDFPMHLAVGEWIVRHGWVPFEEPFAWTRPGAPYYAYSWLPQTAFYLVHAAFGPIGLRLLQGVLLTSTAGAVVLLGRAAGWRSGTLLLLAAAHVIATSTTVPALRPQLLLALIIPAAWAVYYRAAAAERIWPHCLGMLLLSAVLANSHLFFVLTLSPICLVWIDPRLQWRRGLAVVVATMAGWFLTPYALHWPEVFQANLGYNALLAWPSPIAELIPGFRAMGLYSPDTFLPALALLAAPWLLARRGVPQRELACAALYWTVGLLGFGLAVRLQLVWWLLFLPFAGRLVDALSAAQPDDPPRVRVRILGYVAVLGVLAVSVAVAAKDWRLEGDVSSRRLATEAARGLEPLAAWLDSTLHEDATGRVHTSFELGSYLTWRLPRLSSSIDTRTIFPDSVARAHALVSNALTAPTDGPWRSADLVLLPTHYRIAASLDSAVAWRRAAFAVLTAEDARRTGTDTIALWVRQDWWAQASASPLPAAPVRLPDSLQATRPNRR